MGGETVIRMATAAAAPLPRTFSVLVVEDDVMIRLVIADRLRDNDFTVVEASNADEAITLLQSQVPVDLVFTEVRMPGAIAGVALARRVRETHPDMKLIVASGNSDIENDKVPADAFFRKPYDL